MDDMVLSCGRKKGGFNAVRLNGREKRDEKGESRKEKAEEREGAASRPIADS